MVQCRYPIIVSLLVVVLVTNFSEVTCSSYFGYRPPENYPEEYLAMAVEEGDDLGRTVPKKLLQSNSLNSPIYYIRLPPQPYMFVPGLGYISQPPPSPVSPYVNLPIRFLANGKPSTIYQWSANFDGFAPPTQESLPQKPQQTLDSTIHKLPGQYVFNGKPENIFTLRDSYNSLYGDALQHFYP